jgi:predicted DNA-binding transcriptional regulator YafY
VAKGDVLARWMRLLTAVQGGQSYTAKALAEKAEVSVRTIFRDLDGLQKAGMPLFFDPEQKKYRLTENFFLPPLHFTAEELWTLLAAVDYIRRQPPYGRVAHALMEKLIAALPVGRRVAATRMKAAVGMEPLGAHGMEDEQTVRALEQALERRRKVRIRYATFSRSGEETVRVVRPFGMAHRGTSLYLIGYCELRQDIRTFRTGRIRQLELLPDPAPVPADFDLDRFLLGVWGITDGEEIDVTLRFDPSVAPLARETLWHPTQQVQDQADGGALVTMRARGRAELARWIAGYGGHVTVLAPPELRADLRAIGTGILAAQEG